MWMVVRHIRNHVRHGLQTLNPGGNQPMHALPQCWRAVRFTMHTACVRESRFGCAILWVTWRQSLGIPVQELSLSQ